MMQRRRRWMGLVSWWGWVASHGTHSSSLKFGTQNPPIKNPQMALGLFWVCGLELGEAQGLVHAPLWTEDLPTHAPTSIFAFTQTQSLFLLFPNLKTLWPWCLFSLVIDRFLIILGRIYKILSVITFYYVWKNDYNKL